MAVLCHHPYIGASRSCRTVQQGTKQRSASRTTATSRCLPAATLAAPAVLRLSATSSRQECPQSTVSKQRHLLSSIVYTVLCNTLRRVCPEPVLANHRFAIRKTDRWLFDSVWSGSLHLRRPRGDDVPLAVSALRRLQIKRLRSFRG